MGPSARFSVDVACGFHLDRISCSTCPDRERNCNKDLSPSHFGSKTCLRTSSFVKEEGAVPVPFDVSQGWPENEGSVIYNVGCSSHLGFKIQTDFSVRSSCLFIHILLCEHHRVLPSIADPDNDQGLEPQSILFVHLLQESSGRNSANLRQGVL